MFKQHIKQLENTDNKVYAPNKWTVKEIIQHLIDTERIFINRALRIVRLDKTEIPGYDENSYVNESNVNNRTISDLLEEYNIVRLSTYYFFKNLNHDELIRTSNANKQKISALAVAYVLIGHPIHHFNVIKNKYFTL